MLIHNPYRCECGCLKPYNCDRSGSCGIGILNQDIDRIWAEQDFSQYYDITTTGNDTIMWDLYELSPTFVKAKLVLVRIIAKATNGGTLWFTLHAGSSEIDPVLAPDPDIEDVEYELATSSDWQLYEFPLSINEDTNNRDNWVSASLRIRRSYTKMNTHYIRAMEVCVD